MKLSVSQKHVACVASRRTAAHANFFYAQIDLKLIRDRGCIRRGVVLLHHDEHELDPAALVHVVGVLGLHPAVGAAADSRLD